MTANGMANGTSSTGPAVCIVGAGVSGLSAAKAMHQSGVSFDCYEKGSKIGGLWRLDNDSGLAAAYEHLSTNTSTKKMAFSDFPWPKDAPPHPRHSEMVQYLENYVDHFGFGDSIHCGTGITQIAPDAEGGYLVTVKNEKTGETMTKHYDKVVVASGHNWDAIMPNWPGQDSFKGQLIHAHNYRHADMLDGKRVCVVGVGNSGLDIATESARHAAETYLSTRRGVHIMPRNLPGGLTVDDLFLGNPLFVFFPKFLLEGFARFAIWLRFGNRKAYPLPAPKFGVLSAPVSIHDDILPLCRAGRVKVKPGIERLDGKNVIFTDSSSLELDMIIAATGYRISFPFFSKDMPALTTGEASGENVQLYQRVLHPDLPGMFFIGYFRPAGPYIPLCEAQGEYVNDLLLGRIESPDPDLMRAVLDKKQHPKDKDGKEIPMLNPIGERFYPYLLSLKMARFPGGSYLARLWYQAKAIVSLKDY